MIASLPLSRRQADASKLLTSLESDQQLQSWIAQPIDEQAMQNLIAYVAQAYGASDTDAEEAIQHLIRGLQQRRQGTLTNRRLGQDAQIVIPPTAENPVGRTIPVEKASTPPPAQKPLTVDATPTPTTETKEDAVTKPLKDSADTRQQKLINSIRALKVAIATVALDMYSVELLEDGQGKVVTKVIEQISAVCAEQTADSVKALVSPLLGQS